jgi:formate-dependent nitrite reductase membrane component NrfD
VRRPEKETRPKLFYKGAHQATLDPLAARRPEGGLFMWSEQYQGPGSVVSGHSGPANSSAAALLSYDVSHAAPWDWRVSLYTWTKGIAAGAYLVPLVLVALGAIDATSVLWDWVAPVLAGGFLAATGGLLIWDLEHPARFYLIFTRPQWKSWLVKGAVIIGGYSVVLAGHFAASAMGATRAHGMLAVPGAILALLTAVYTAYLFAQAKGRDLWQNPLLPAHFAVQAVLGGAAALLPFAAWLEPAGVSPLLGILGGAAALHVLLVAGEVTLTHATAHARLATLEMVRGKFRPFFWAGAVLVVGAAFAPWIGLTAVPLALLGLLAHEHAYVQAGQAVPLA